jgi:hypothetical protein
MRQTLRLHPDSLRFAVTQVEVEVSRPQTHSLMLAYVVTGKISDLLMPPVAAAARTDELWQHTCFEAFVRSLPGAAYYEFNFAPSTQWAAYQFSGYRRGMRVATEIKAPSIAVESSPEHFILQASLELDQLWIPAPSGGVAIGDTMWRLGLSAVVEEANGRRSYWALAHPPGEADFHHPDGFTLKLPEA